MRKCPYCNREVSNDSTICEYCGESLVTQCPYCKENINVTDRVCPNCSSKLRANPISLLVKSTYVMLFLNAFIPFWLANSINAHPVFWSGMTAKKDDFYDLISLVITVAVISATPSIIAIISNYRKRVCTISIILIILFCICNIILLANI